MRESLIDNAVAFLTDTTVQKSDHQRQVNFLKSKGLTQEEIDAACNRVAKGVPNNTNVNESTPPLPSYPPPQIKKAKNDSPFPWSSLLLMTTFMGTSGWYLFQTGAMMKLKNYVSSWLKNENNLAIEKLWKLEESINDLKEEVEFLRDDIKYLQTRVETNPILPNIIEMGKVSD